METSLTLLYTGGLRGDLAVLPRLYTFIRQLKARVATLYPGQPVLLIDQGAACAPDMWHCAVSGGRSALLALDGMGYDAAVNDGFAGPHVRDKLGPNVNLAIIDADRPFVRGGVACTVGDGLQTGAPFSIRLDPAPSSRLAGNALYLQTVSAGQVGEVRIEAGRMAEAALHFVPPVLAPDPTIAGIIDFILAEARYTQKKRERTHPDE